MAGGWQGKYKFWFQIFKIAVNGFQNPKEIGNH
jgi:hypothetical protein